VGLESTAADAGQDVVQVPLICDPSVFVSLSGIAERSFGVRGANRRTLRSPTNSRVLDDNYREVGLYPGLWDIQTENTERSTWESVTATAELGTRDILSSAAETGTNDLMSADTGRGVCNLPTTITDRGTGTTTGETEGESSRVLSSDERLNERLGQAIMGTGSSKFILV